MFIRFGGNSTQKCRQVRRQSEIFNFTWRTIENIRMKLIFYILEKYWTWLSTFLYFSSFHIPNSISYPLPSPLREALWKNLGSLGQIVAQIYTILWWVELFTLQLVCYVRHYHNINFIWSDISFSSFRSQSNSICLLKNI